MFPRLHVSKREKRKKNSKFKELEVSMMIEKKQVEKGET